MGWRMRCEVHLAVAFEGELRVDDPDGIVVEAAFVPPRECDDRLASCAPWVREPLCAWLRERWEPAAGRGLRTTRCTAPTRDSHARGAQRTT